MSKTLTIDIIRGKEQDAYEDFLELRNTYTDFSEMYSEADFSDWYNDIYLGEV
jgi:hypothetical protein